jgi:hypothetical protein
MPGARRRGLTLGHSALYGMYYDHVLFDILMDRRPRAG